MNNKDSLYKYRRSHDRIYTATDFADGEIVRHMHQAFNPAGYSWVQSVSTGNIRLINLEEEAEKYEE